MENIDESKEAVKEAEGEGEKSNSESSEQDTSQEVIHEPVPFNELAQGYYPIEELKTDPTYEEMIIECSSKTGRSLKYLEQVLSTKQAFIFPDKEDFEFFDKSGEDSKNHIKSISSEFKSAKENLMVPTPLAIEVGKLESLNNESIVGDDATQKSRESIFSPGSPSCDYSKVARLKKITPLMVATITQNHSVWKLLINNAK